MIKKLLSKLSEFEKMIFISMTFTVVMVTLRYLYTDDRQYFFYPWNLFLATVPLFFSRQLKRYKKFNLKASVLLFCWLLFLPNAPYIITDIFHLEERPLIPYWFDLLIVISGAWNGIALCITSLMQVERFLAKHIKRKWRLPSTLLLITLCSYGIFLGRYKRYNSWNIITNPGDIIHTFISHIAEPREHIQAWMFTVSFAMLLTIIYFTVKKIPGMLKVEKG
ncbi:DUF1361 domain-containing protein [Panacibacter ginsenosidivorans]|uniref:DUF1361 domain-containing protein n=1 Tax=Panacibacter ginsenosidivorans TaxID=1813871 RepID=A0A5B8VAA0_9BACT|nr:DUF1361 domain-containing protein [Panacibacter ginsenosidivorans]QEC67626.1 DUF1361 domain-containing protein [Panacibacter ginsenosidivorans]